MAFYDTNPNFRAQPYEDPAKAYTVEQEMKRQAYMAQQQERYQPINSGPQVTKPMDLANQLEAYENLLVGLREQLDVLESRLSPMLLDYPNDPMVTNEKPSLTGSPMTTRVYCLNVALREAAERVARITHAVNL